MVCVQRLASSNQTGRYGWRARAQSMGLLGILYIRAQPSFLCTAHMVPTVSPERLSLSLGTPSSYPLFWFVVAALAAAICCVKRCSPRLVDCVLPDTESNVRNTLAFAFFLFHIFVPLSWYVLAYDPRGSYIASWTRVFG